MSRRVVPLLVLCLLVAGTRTVAAQVNLAATFGWVQYDMAGDDPYFTFGIQVRYYVTPVVRVGFMGGTAHIGDPPLRDWTLDGTDERMWRGAGFIEFGTKPLHKASASIRGLLGVFHSSGVIVEPTPPNSGGWYGITDTPTGVTYGGGLGVEAGPYWRFRLYAQGNIWLDHAYGSGAFDPELIFGMGVDL